MLGTVFAHDLSDTTLEQIRVAANKVWALEDDRFSDQIQAQLRWRVAASSREVVTGDPKRVVTVDRSSLTPKPPEYTPGGMSP